MAHVEVAVGVFRLIGMILKFAKRDCRWRRNIMGPLAITPENPSLYRIKNGR